MSLESPHVWCKYGVVTEDDLVADLERWTSFHLAGRLHKPALFLSAPEQCVPPTLHAALLKSRSMAIAAALLQHPEIFTFRKLLETILSLSYIGDIRLPFAEDPSKIQKLLQAQLFPLADLYLGLLGAPTQQWNWPHGTSLQPAAPDPVHPDGDADHAGGRRPVRPVVAYDPASRNILRVACLPSELAEATTSSTMAPDVLQAITEAAEHVAAQSTQRLMGETEQMKNVSSSPRSALAKALLSDAFILQQDKSDEACEYVFSLLPDTLRRAASNASASIRFRRLVSPFSLLSNKRLNAVLGHPLPHDKAAIQSALQTLNRQSSLSVAVKSVQTAGPVRCAQYAFPKFVKRIAGAFE